MVLTDLFLEMNAAGLSVMTAAGAIHEATVVQDFGYASDKHPSGPLEQHTHSFIERHGQKGVSTPASLHKLMQSAA